MVIKFNPMDKRSIEEAIKQTKKRKAWLKEKTREFVERLAEEGVVIATGNFVSAVYDGDKGEIAIRAHKTAKNEWTISATGDTVLFIEFGTGTVQADDHPDKPHEVSARGTYGKGRGRFGTWEYYGSPGSNGRIVGFREGKGLLIRTAGNPANKSMYMTVQELRERCYTIAREVFR